MVRGIPNAKGLNQVQKLWQTVINTETGCRFGGRPVEEVAENNNEHGVK